MGEGWRDVGITAAGLRFDVAKHGKPVWTVHRCTGRGPHWACAMMGDGTRTVGLGDSSVEDHSEHVGHHEPPHVAHHVTVISDA